MIIDILNLWLLLKDFNNTDLMQELQRQDSVYLDKIIKQNNEILKLLENMKELFEEVKKQAERKIKDLGGDYNLEQIGIITDVIKDIEEVDKMYNDYGTREYGGYNARGYDTKYRGYGHIDRMHGEYGRYENGRESYNRGNYSAKEDTLKALKLMLESAEDFLRMIKNEANSPEEMQIFQEYAKRFSQM